MFGILNNYWVLLLALLPVVYFLLRKIGNLRITLAASIGIYFKHSGTNTIAVIGIIGLLILGLTRPYFGYQDIKISSSAGDLVVALDISTSMLADDLGQSRLQVAKHKIEDLLQILSASGRAERVGLVLFAGDSYLFCPPTPDYAAVRIFTKAISPELITAQGSNLTDAIETAAESLKQVKAVRGKVLMMTDGEDQQFDQAKASRALSKVSAKFAAIGMGTLEGSPIKLHNGAFVRDSKDQVVISRLNEEGLKETAQQADGLYQRVTLNDQDIQQILLQWNNLDLNQGSRRTEQQIRSYNEIGPYFALAALIIFGVLLFKKAPLVTLFILGPLLILPPLARADDSAPNILPERPAQDSVQPGSSLYDGYQAYQAGEYKKSLETFRKAFGTKTKDQLSEKELQALGSAEYKTGNFQEALQSFSKATEKANNGKNKFNSLYNKGNTELMLKKYQDAVESYKQALNFDGQNVPAKHNRDLARALLEEQEKQQQQNQQDNQNKDQKKQEQNKEQQSPSPTPTQNDQQNDQEQEKQSEQDDQQQKDEQPQPKDQSEQKEEGGSNKENTPEEQQSSPESSEKDKKDSDLTENQPTSTPTVGPTSKPVEQPQPSEDGDKQASSSSDGAKDGKPISTKELQEREVKAWLDSLDDNPAILRKKSRSKEYRGQTW